jgi:hypothetical protein
MRRTFQKKTVNTVFRVRNIAQDQRTIRIFGTPIYYDAVRDLLSIPEISESDIRHSLLKGELKEQKQKRFIEVTESTIDLTQFDSEQRAFLQSLGISSGIASAPDSVANITELSAIDDSLFTDGTIVGMLSLRDIWQLNRDSDETADGITIIDTNSGSGQWLRKELSDRYWGTRPTWYIDPSSGNDENYGATEGLALKTLSELARRWKDQFINQHTTVHILSSLSATDFPHLRFTVNESGFVLFKGTTTTIATGTLTAVTERNPATNQPNEITDTGLSDNWGTLGYVNERIRLTSGSNIGACAWIAKDLGSKEARVSSWMVDTAVDLESLPWDSMPDNCEAAATDDYIIEDLPVVYELMTEISCNSEGAAYERTRVVFEDLSICPNLDRDATLFIKGDRVSCCLNRCYLGYVEPGPGTCLPLINCTTANVSMQNNTVVYMMGGFVRLWLNVGGMSEVAVGNAVLVNGGIYIYGGKVSLFGGGACIMETGSYNGVELAAGARLITEGFPIFGNCDTGTGVVVKSASAFIYKSTSKPTITGSGGDAEVGGTSKTWAEIPFYNVANGAALVET